MMQHAAHLAKQEQINQQNTVIASNLTHRKVVTNLKHQTFCSFDGGGFRCELLSFWIDFSKNCLKSSHFFLKNRCFLSTKFTIFSLQTRKTLMSYGFLKFMTQKC